MLDGWEYEVCGGWIILIDRCLELGGFKKKKKVDNVVWVYVLDFRWFGLIKKKKDLGRRNITK